MPNWLFLLMKKFDPVGSSHPTIFCSRQVPPIEEYHNNIAKQLLSGHIKCLLPDIYCVPSFYIPYIGSAIIPYRVAFALAEQHEWRLEMPAELGQFLMGRCNRPDVGKLNHFFYDQPEQRHFSYEQPNPKDSNKESRLTLTPAADNRIFTFSHSSQAIVQHIQMHPDASQEELLVDAKFAASSWLAERAEQREIKKDLAAGLFLGKEKFLAETFLDSVSTEPFIPDHAPEGFDPTPHEATAARIYHWIIVKSEYGNSYLCAQYIENHNHIKDGKSLAKSTPLVWYDVSLGWARTRSRYYRLVGPGSISEC